MSNNDNQNNSIKIDIEKGKNVPKRNTNLNNTRTNKNMEKNDQNNIRRWVINNVKKYLDKKKA